jgi:hypothetical protein
LLPLRDVFSKAEAMQNTGGCIHYACWQHRAQLIELKPFFPEPKRTMKAG